MIKSKAELDKIKMNSILVEYPDEDLFEDGEIEHKDEVFDKINYHLFVKGDWTLIRRKR